MPSSRVTRFVTAGTVVVALGAGALHGGSAGAATKTTRLAFFEQQATVKQTATTIEFTSLLFVGDARHHARSWTATDHYLCTFGADGPPPATGRSRSAIRCC